MKVDEDLIDIIRLCKEVDSKAIKIYTNFSSRFEDKDLNAQWKNMAAEEKDHVEYWHRLLELALEGAVPQLFDDPFRIKEDLEAMMPRIDRYVKESSYSLGVKDAFFIACHLEFFMLHRSFIALFLYLQSVCDDIKAGNEYEIHLAEFIENLNKYGISDELKIFGDIIAQMWKDNNDLIIQSTRDYLTGAFNRKGFYQVVMPLAYMARRYGRNVGMLMIDGDDFKAVNDNYGHQKGDEVLKFISKAIKGHLRSSDVVGRYGGEEFVVFLSEVEQGKLYDVAEKIRQSISEDSGFDFTVTVSIGASQKQVGEDIDSEISYLIKSADDLLYEAKRTGKDRVVLEHQAQGTPL